jgi:hypothetical protein
MIHKTIEQYDNYLEENITSYTVTKYLGLGKYKTFPHKTLEESRIHLSQLKVTNPNGRFLIYGISTPKDKLYSISVPIA